MSLQRIAIIKLSSIGDCVLASPVPRALKRADPQRHITWVVEERQRELVETNPFVDQVITVAGPDFRSLLAAGREVRRRQFDAILDLQGILKSSLLVVMSGCRRRVTGSFARAAARRVATEIADTRGVRHAALLYLRCAEPLDADVSDPKLIAPVTDEDRQFADLLLSENQCPPWPSPYPAIRNQPEAPSVVEGQSAMPLFGLNPGASRSDKRWPPERFAEVAARLASEFQMRPILFGGPNDQEIAESVRRIAPSTLIDVVGRTTLRQLTALAARCRLFLTNDSGPMHLACAAGTRVVAVFGASNPAFTGPFGDGHLVCWKARSYEEARRRGTELLAALSAE